MTISKSHLTRVVTSLSGPPPEGFAPFFQEYRISGLDVGRHRDLIIERVLAFGDRAQVRWLLRTYGRREVVAWLQRDGRRRLPRRRFVLWTVALVGVDPPAPDESKRPWPH